MLKASVRKDLREDDWLIAVQVGSDNDPSFEWATFTDRPAKVFSESEDHRYQVVLEDGRVVIADSIDLEFEGTN